jgi:DMSO reductase anchor subunit
VFCLLAVFLFQGFVFLAAIASLLAAVLERWLFFAEARHIVMAYYQG